MPPKTTSRRPLPKAAAPSSSSTAPAAGAASGDKKEAAPTKLPIDPSWYFLPSLPEHIAGSSRGPLHRRMVSLHCKAPGMPTDSVLRVPPDTTIAYVKERLALQHGGAVQNVELFKELLQRGERIDERSAVRGPPSLTVREAWNLDEADHQAIQLPHLAAPNLGATHLPHQFGTSMGAFASSHSFGNIMSVQSSVVSGGGTMRIANSSATINSDGSSLYGGGMLPAHGTSSSSTAGGSMHQNPSNPVIGSATRFSPVSATSQQQPPPHSPTSGGTTNNNSPSSAFPSSSPTHRRQGSHPGSASSGARAQVTFASDGAGNASSGGGGGQLSSRGSSRYGSPNASERAASGGSGQHSHHQQLPSSQQQQQQQRHSPQKKIPAFANPDTVGHANYFVTMTNVPTSRGSAAKTTGAVVVPRAISPSEQRHQEEGLLHVEDDHVIVYYTFGAHGFPAPLLIGGVKDLCRGAVPETNVDVKQKYDAVLRTVQHQSSDADNNKTKTPTQRQKRRLRRWRRALDAGRKEDFVAASLSDIDDDADDDYDEFADSDESLDGGAQMEAKMQEMVVEAAAERQAMAAASAGEDE